MIKLDIFFDVLKEPIDIGTIITRLDNHSYCEPGAIIKDVNVDAANIKEGVSVSIKEVLYLASVLQNIQNVVFLLHPTSKRVNQ